MTRKSARLTASDLEWAAIIARSIGIRARYMDLEELVQVARIECWKRRRAYDPSRNGEFQGYAFKAVSGAVRMVLRRDARRERIPAAPVPQIQPQADTTIDEARAAAATRRAVGSAISQLPYWPRLILILRYFAPEPLTVRRVAAELEVSPSWVVLMERQAREAIRGPLEAYVD